MKANPAIQSVTASTSVPGAEVGGSSSYYLKNSLGWQALPEPRC
jgi:hypothetical protein